jgi:tRNA A-37 threonylcarbamoyl transferase component Bud32
MRGLEKISNQVPSTDDLYEDLVKKLGELPAVKKIIDSVENEGDLSHEEAVAKLKKIAVSRQNILDNPTIEYVGTVEYEIEQEQAINFVRNVRMAKSNPDNFLGNGAVADVCSLGKINNGANPICAKFIINNDRYGEGNDIRKETFFNDLLRDLEIAGVRAPKPLYIISTHDLKFLVMEEFVATNFKRILEKQTTKGIKDELPENFNLDEFFSNLKKYLEEIHKMGIYHGDIALRNIMVDRETSRPRLIDFGKAKLEAELDKTNVNQADWARLDLAALESAKLEAKKWLEEQKRIDID